MTTTNPEQWADKVLDDVIIAWSEHGHSAGIEAIQAAFAEREARLVGALEWYGEQARLARLIHDEGDAGRHALSRDGGKLATDTLAALKDRTHG